MIEWKCSGCGRWVHEMHKEHVHPGKPKNPRLPFLTDNSGQPYTLTRRQLEDETRRAL